MNFPVEVEEFLETAAELGCELTDDTISFINLITNLLNDAYYQGVADGRCFV